MSETRCQSHRRILVVDDNPAIHIQTERVVIDPTQRRSHPEARAGDFVS